MALISSKSALCPNKETAMIAFENFETTGAPVHTLVRGRFVQKDRKICPNIKGHGTQVSDIQEMPPAKLNNAEHAIENLLRR